MYLSNRKSHGIFTLEELIKTEVSKKYSSSIKVLQERGIVTDIKKYKEYPNKMIYVIVKFSGSSKNVQYYDANKVNKQKAISLAKKLAKRNNGTYEGFRKFTL